MAIWSVRFLPTIFQSLGLGGIALIDDVTSDRYFRLTCTTENLDEVFVGAETLA